jgi:general secretion pathway protein K
MIGRPSERGAALLTVLLLVAVMAAVAATALDRIGLASRLTANARDAMQERAWLTTAELLATTKIEDLKAAQPNRVTLAGNWVPRQIALPDGRTVTATVGDGGNCFNLNALVRLVNDTVVSQRPEGLAEFRALMNTLGLDPGRAASIAASAADYIDDDDMAAPGGVERSGYPVGALPANRPMADRSELRAVPGVKPEEYRVLEPWICALPVLGKSPLNVNTLSPEQAPLVVMMMQGKVDLNLARRVLASRPQGGWSNAGELFNAPEFKGAGADVTQAEAGVNTDFFTLDLDVGRPGELASGERALIDARQKPARVIARQWGEFL